MYLKSSNIPVNFLKFGRQALHFVAIPAFFFLFMILYKPFGLEEHLELHYGSFTFNISIITAIIFVVLLISRLSLWGVGRSSSGVKKRTYFVWCLLEIVAVSLFVGLYVTKMSAGVYTYVDIVPVAFTYLTGILVFPYVILFLILESDLLARLGENEPSDSRMHFYDEKHILKFVTDPSAVLYIESDENYCNIFYYEGGSVKSVIIRCTMKGISEMCEQAGILRCHRSYFVNTRRIKVLKKEREGLSIAQLDVPSLKGIPVTPRYYDSIADRL